MSNNSKQLYHFEGDEEILKKLLQTEQYSISERTELENEFYDKVENNLFNLAILLTKDMTMQELLQLSSKDLRQLIEKYASSSTNNNNNSKQ